MPFFLLNKMCSWRSESRNLSVLIYWFKYSKVYQQRAKGGLIWKALRWQYLLECFFYLVRQVLDRGNRCEWMGVAHDRDTSHPLCRLEKRWAQWSQWRWRLSGVWNSDYEKWNKCNATLKFICEENAVYWYLLALYVKFLFIKSKLKHTDALRWSML